jgi:membrane protein implicated in regulation of membrane protease activity
VGAALLLVLEMLSLSFFLLPFAIGAVAAAILNFIGVELVWQVSAFIVVSGIALAALRPFARRITKKADDVKMGAERLVGMRGTVIEGQSKSGEFRVMVGGEPWNASSQDGSRLKPKTLVQVLAVNSNSLLVADLPVEAPTATATEQAAQTATQPKNPIDAPQFVDVDESRKKTQETDK